MAVVEVPECPRACGVNKQPVRSVIQIPIYIVAREWGIVGIRRFSLFVKAIVVGEPDLVYAEISLIYRLCRLIERVGSIVVSANRQLIFSVGWNDASPVEIAIALPTGTTIVRSGSRYRLVECNRQVPRILSSRCFVQGAVSVGVIHMRGDVLSHVGVIRHFRIAAAASCPADADGKPGARQSQSCVGIGVERPLWNHADDVPVHFEFIAGHGAGCCLAAAC